MKSIFLSLTTLAVSTVSFAQWQATSASSTTNNVIQDFCEHQNSLYFSSYEGIKKWDAGSEQWNTVSFDGFELYSQEFVEHLVSTGDYLYATKWNPFCASNMVYKSSDNGLNFVPDTLGLPQNGACDSVPSAILAFFALPNGNLVAEFGADFYTKSPTDAGWVIDNDMRRYMTFSSTAWYKLTGSALNKSVDEGQTWTSTATTSFPPGMQPSVLEINSTTGRIYYNAKYGFDNVSLYTDDEGTTWDTLHVNDVLGNSWIGTEQIVHSLIAKGDEIVFGAEQNSNGSHPEIYASSDGGVTFSSDTIGLPSNAGIEYAIDFHLFNNELFLVFNSFEIYRKGEGLGISEIEHEVNISLYPNPTKDKIYLNSDKEIEAVSVYNLQGKLINHIAWNSSNSFVDISNVPNGIYFVKIRTKEIEVTRRIFKN